MIYDSSIFSNVHFFLAGFAPQQHLEVKSKLVSEGGVYFEEYGPDCTHVIVENIVLDDPICVAARRDGKALVTRLWVDDSLDSGEPVEPNLLLYRPPKDLNGIPGANELFMSLTGFQRPERDDIMTMVRLMGARFSKAMVANKVTHLICYKFEGEKYELAKRFGFTKLVNSYWVEDCLKAWRLLPEEHYSKSNYELEMEAEVKDSEDETEDVIGRNTTEITNMEAHNHSVLASKVSILPTEQGFSNNSSINDRKLKSDKLTESINANQSDKQPSRDHRDLFQMDNKLDNVDVQNAKSNQVEFGFPSTSGNARNSSDSDAKPSLNYSKTKLKTSPLSSRKTPHSKASLKTDGNCSKPDGRLSQAAVVEKVIDEVPTFNLETDTEEAASAGIGRSSSERLADSDVGKHSPLNLKESPRRFSLSLQSAGGLTRQDRKEEKHSPEKGIVDVCTSDTGADQGKAALASGTSSAEAGLFDVKDAGAALPQKRTAGSNVSHTISKSQKLASSASKRVSSAEPKTRVNSSLKKSKCGALKSESQIRDECAGPSPYLSTSKSNVNNAAPSSDLLQGSKPTNMDPLTSPKTNSGSPSLDDGKNKGQLQNLHNNGADSPGVNDLEAVTSRSPKLNSGDSNGNAFSKSRKKMVARKTLGSKLKVSNRKADAQGNFISRSSDPDNLGIDSVGFEDKEELAPSLAADKVFKSPTVDKPINLGAKPHLKSSTKINQNADLLADDNGAPPELDEHNEKPQTAESHLVKSTTGEVSGELFSQTDEAKVTSAASKETYQQEKPVAETVGVEQNLVAKKGKGAKAKKKNLIAAKEAVKDVDGVEGGKSSSSKVKEPTLGAAAKKRQGTLLLNKPKQSVEVENENRLVYNDRVEVGREIEPDLNDQDTKGVNCSRKLAVNKRGTPINKSKGLDVENGNESEFDVDKGESDGTQFSGKLAASSNTTQGDEEDKNKIDLGVCNGQGISEVAKCSQKLAGKKRRGTVLLKKSDVLDDELQSGKLAGASSIGRPMDDDKENGPVFGKNKGTSKGGKCAGKLSGKKRRGTLVLDKYDAQVDEGKTDQGDAANKRDEDKISGGVVTEKLTSKSNLTADESAAANSHSLNCHDSKEVKKQSACFILSGHRLQRKEFQKLIKRLRGKVCRDSHQWSYQASHFIVPDPIRRTEKFFAAAASGSWILKTDYLTASNQAGKFLAEEPYEWHKNGLNEDGAISLEAPRKWRLLRERTGHGAFYGMQIETLKRAVNAGDGTILATSPPYTRFLESGIDFAVISPGMPRVDVWVQEFLRHQIPCVSADYLVEYVCKPGYSLDRHVQYNTHEWAAKSFSKLLSLSEEVVVDDVTTPDDQVSDDLACQVCGSTDRGEVMLVCGNETGSAGCGIGTHIDCCDPPLEDIPEEDWFCPKCSESVNKLPRNSKKKKSSQRI
ncbi:hypothetical protein RDABS01_017955 [Bienertia sinuspersici]